MRKVLIIAMSCVALSPTANRGADTWITIYDTEGNYDCLIEDTSPGLVTVHVVEEFAQDVSGVRFRIIASDGFNMVYQYELPSSPVVGNTQDGIEINWVLCDYSDYRVLVSVTYLSLGTTDPCSNLMFGPHPDATTDSVEIQDCNDKTWQTPSIVHGIYTMCIEPGSAWCILQPPVETEPSTWGRVKALYQ